MAGGGISDTIAVAVGGIFAASLFAVAFYIEDIAPRVRRRGASHVMSWRAPEFRREVAWLIIPLALLRVYVMLSYLRLAALFVMLVVLWMWRRYA